MSDKGSCKAGHRPRDYADGGPGGNRIRGEGGVAGVACGPEVDEVRHLTVGYCKVVQGTPDGSHLEFDAVIVAPFEIEKLLTGGVYKNKRRDCGAFHGLRAPVRLFYVNGLLGKKYFQSGVKKAGLGFQLELIGRHDVPLADVEFLSLLRHRI